ncbi:GNAT family N-acetyltransferase, partial [Couchioplanes azureus]
MYPLTLAGPSVVLREFRETDLEAVHAVVGDQRVTDWLSFDARTPEQATTMLSGILSRAQEEPRHEYYLAVALPRTDVLVGFVRLALDGVQAGKLGYAIAYDHWGHGYATDAIRSMVTFGF